MTAAARHATPYVTATRLKKLVEIARAAGLDVDGAGVEFSPDGTVRLLPARAVAPAASPFDEWEKLL